MKKTLSFILSLIMIMGIVLSAPVTVYAADEIPTLTDGPEINMIALADRDYTQATVYYENTQDALKLGMDMLAREEQVETDTMLGHGGFFKTPGVGQQIMADALNVPITTLETAGEGGPWGMALLAAYMIRKDEGESMEDYLMNRVFSKAKRVCVQPDPAGVAGFARYIERYQACLPAENAAAAMK